MQYQQLLGLGRAFVTLPSILAVPVPVIASAGIIVLLVQTSITRIQPTEWAYSWKHFRPIIADVRFLAPADHV
jgi:hypothetical protein